MNVLHTMVCREQHLVSTSRLVTGIAMAVLPQRRAVLNRAALTVSLLIAVAAPARGDADAAALAQAVQNPIADMISLPLQGNINFDAGPREKTQSVLNVQPVVPFNLNAKWNLITRTIVPIISQPAFTQEQERENGIGDVQLSGFLSPAAANRGWVWGGGMVAQLDTATDDRLGQGAWGLGPTAVALHLGKTWVYGALINNVWSVSEDGDRGEVNQMLIQPFVNYNFPDSPGRYLTFAPIVTANWEADSGQKWTVPLGIGIGQVTRFGEQPVNMQMSAYYNIERPDFAPRWQLRLQLQWLFPK